MLAGFASADQAIVQMNQYFSVLPSGAIPPNPSELLASLDFEKLISTFKQSYDYIIIDTAPVGIVSDALSVGKLCDGVLIVVKAKSTTYADFERVSDSLKLAGITLLGAVINGAEVKEYYPNYRSN